MPTSSSGVTTIVSAIPGVPRVRGEGALEETDDEVTTLLGIEHLAEP